MIIVAGTLTITPELIGDFARDVAEMVERVRAEAGCSHYSLLVEDAATGLVNVIEQWEDDAALLVHFTQPWIAEFSGRYGSHMLASTVRVFDIAGERPLPSM